MDFDSLFESFMEKKVGKVVKTIPATKEEALEWMQLVSFGKMAQKAAAVHATKKKVFWGKVEERLGEYERSLSFDEEKQEIQVHDKRGGSSTDEDEE